MMLAVLALAAAVGGGSDTHSTDSRSLFNGTTMVTDGYLDQPYCATFKASGRILCTVTASEGAEGSHGEHITSLYSDDRGRTWSSPVSVEPSPLNTRLANAYSMTIIAERMGSSGEDRAYAIYSMNLDNITSFPGDAPGSLERVDMMGKFVMRWSDNQGQNWSQSRVIIPYRITSIDRNNEWHGNTTIMWTVDTTKVRDGTVYFGFTKIGKYLLGPPEEMWILSSDNLLSEPDPSKIEWRLLPDGDVGIKPVGGEESTNIEEAHVLPMTAEGAPGIYLFGRTTTGWLVESHTSDSRGSTGWTPTAYAQYFDPQVSPKRLSPLSSSATGFGTSSGASAGIKNPRGPTMAKQFSNSLYLLLYYNNYQKSYAGNSRNPYWLAAGHEVSGDGASSHPTVLWSQPEIALYDGLDFSDRPGYPDFIEDQDADGNIDVFITETQKTVARIHRVDRGLLSGLFGQANASGMPSKPAVTINSQDSGKSVSMPPLPAFPDAPLPSSTLLGTVSNLGFSVIAELSDHANASQGDIMLTSATSVARNSRGGTISVNGFEVAIGHNGSVILSFGDGKTMGQLATDPLCTEVLRRPGAHFWAAVADGGPRIITTMVDGVLCDGGAIDEQGWAWFDPISLPVHGSNTLKVTPQYGGVVTLAHIYNRRLSTSDLVATFRAMNT